MEILCTVQICGLEYIVYEQDKAKLCKDAFTYRKSTESGIDEQYPGLQDSNNELNGSIYPHSFMLIRVGLISISQKRTHLI